MPADVTICIPAWNAEAFIDRTIGHARGQTHSRLKILISIDQCDDATARLSEAQAREDARIEVFVQRERLGWARNVNFLLDRVQTEFFCLYFHDDILLPDYVARLLEALRKRPDAVSAYCDMGHFGASDHVSTGRDYDGPVAKRLAELLVVPERGSPLRSLTRREPGGTDLRLPTCTRSGFWANEPYLMRLIAAGPAIRVPETLYLRWDQRQGGLTDGWKGLSIEEVFAGFSANITDALSIIDKAAASRWELEALTFCLYVNLMPRVRQAELDHGRQRRTADEEVHSRFSNMVAPDSLRDFGADIERWALRRHDWLREIERSFVAT